MAFVPCPLSAAINKAQEHLTPKTTRESGGQESGDIVRIVCQRLSKSAASQKVIPEALCYGIGAAEFDPCAGKSARSESEGEGT